ncbi:PiggyBac transposable element-derived protein 1 [Eumeta japonica]|uniref:PiggyBac transposable element-derived protein 1 n=1 Tax=Eumeta variegata TaxID=151549 RepID=A0A4C1XXE6_EUMVA|nr:PiggyBac transposable element-derived protein 1 [Eumeta japonica]
MKLLLIGTINTHVTAWSDCPLGELLDDHNPAAGEAATGSISKRNQRDPITKALLSVRLFVRSSVTRLYLLNSNRSKRFHSADDANRWAAQIGAAETPKFNPRQDYDVLKSKLYGSSEKKKYKQALKISEIADYLQDLEDCSEEDLNDIEVAILPPDEVDEVTDIEEGLDDEMGVIPVSDVAGQVEFSCTIDQTVYKSSVQLLIDLKSQGFRATGTVRDNRTKKCPIMTKKEMKKKHRASIVRDDIAWNNPEQDLMRAAYAILRRKDLITIPSCNMTVSEKAVKFESIASSEAKQKKKMKIVLEKRDLWRLCPALWEMGVRLRYGMVWRVDIELAPAFPRLVNH